MGLEIGTVGEWVGGLATAGALWAGVLTLRNQHRDREQEQAEFVWFAGTRDRTFLVVTIHNDSHLPIHGVTLFARRGREPLVSQQRPKLLAPAASFTVQVEVPGEGPIHHFVTFHDSGGRYWERASDGRLELQLSGTGRRICRVALLNRLPFLRCDQSPGG